MPAVSVVVPRGVPITCIVWIEVGYGDACAEFLVEADGGGHVVWNDDAVLLVTEQIYRRFFCLLYEIVDILRVLIFFAAILE